MIYHYLALISVLHVLQTIDCSNTTTITSNLKGENETSDTHSDSDSAVKVTKLDPADILQSPIVCYNSNEESLKTLTEVKEHCASWNGRVEKGIFHFDLTYSEEPVVAPDSDETLNLFGTQTEANDPAGKEKKNIRKKRFKRENVYTTDVLNPSGFFECFGCVSRNNVVIFTNVVKLGNETEDCDDGSIDCHDRHKPYVAFDIVLGALVSFLFCVLLLAILSCHPIILDGHYIPLRRIHCPGRSKSSFKVRYRNQTFDSNDFSIVDFD